MFGSVIIGKKSSICRQHWYSRALAQGAPAIGLAPGVAVAHGPGAQARVLVAGVVAVALEPGQALALKPGALVDALRIGGARVVEASLGLAAAIRIPDVVGQAATHLYGSHVRSRGGAFFLN